MAVAKAGVDAERGREQGVAQVAGADDLAVSGIAFTTDVVADAVAVQRPVGGRCIGW